MVVFYDLETKEILRTEDNTTIPLMPFNSTFDEQKEYYRNQNEDFISLPLEMGAYIFMFKLVFDADGKFTGLQPK